MAELPKILACPQCVSKELKAFVSSGNIPSRGETRDWIISCKCGFKIDSLSKDGSEASAIRDWNNVVKEIHILNYLDKKQHLIFDNGLEIIEFIEDHNFSQRQLSMSLTSLLKVYKVEKAEFKAYDIDGIKNGSKINSFTISEHGKRYLSRLNHDWKIVK